MDAWSTLGRQLRHPRGRMGRLSGWGMRLINRAPNRLALAALEVHPGHDVLELGFGPGEALGQLARLVGDGIVHGVDHSRAMFGQAAARNARAVRTGRIRLHAASFDALPLADASVDRILAVNVVYFWDTGEAVLRELDRVLRPGGRISLYATAASAMRRWKFAGSDTHHAFTAQDLYAYLARGPFSPLDVDVREVALWGGLPGLVALVAKPGRVD